MNKNNILLIMAHPDDAFVWCGGLILNFLKININVNIVILSRYNTNNNNNNNKYATDNLICLAKKKGITIRYIKNDSDGTEKLCNLIVKIAPALIITHWREDTHHNHRKTFLLTEEAIKKYKLYMHKENEVRNIKFLQCDSYYSTGLDGIAFPGKIIIDISNLFNEKVKMLKNISDEYYNIIEPMVIIQNRFYGGKIGAKYAEAFLESSSLSSIGGGIGKTNLSGLIDIET